MEDISIEIGKSKNIQREIYRATLFYDKLEISIKEKGKILYKTNVLPGRFSFRGNERMIKERIETIRKRLKLDKIEMKFEEISFFEKFIYKVMLFFKIKYNRYLYPTQWIIGYKNISEDSWNYLEILQNDKMQADPFIVFENEKYYIFYEELYFDENKGYISVSELDLKNNKLINSKKILEKKYHLSYPFVFKENEKWFMIPETSQNKKIELYEAISFPYEWRLKKILLNNIETVDTTIMKKDGIWYLFTSEKQMGVSFNDELSVYYSKNLLEDEFKKIMEYPAISDVTCARMGGKFFLRDGKIYRVSQDCSKVYGYKININEVIELNPKNYIEKRVKSLKHPKDKKIIGMHTYNFINEIEVADFLVVRNDLFGLVSNLKTNLKKIK